MNSICKSPISFSFLIASFLWKSFWCSPLSHENGNVCEGMVNWDNLLATAVAYFYSPEKHSMQRVLNKFFDGNLVFGSVFESLRIKRRWSSITRRRICCLIKKVPPQLLSLIQNWWCPLQCHILRAPFLEEKSPPYQNYLFNYSNLGRCKMFWGH